MSEYFRKLIKKEHYPVQPQNLKFKTNFKNCVLEAMKRRGWQYIENGEDWDIYWAEKEQLQDIFDHHHLQTHQKINHFRNYFELCRKDLMIKNLKRFKKQLEKEGKTEDLNSFNFFPVTYNLPQDYSIFLEEFKRTNANENNKSNQLWIMKPIGKSQGKGIFIFNKLSQISQWKNNNKYDPQSPQAEPYVVQKYISDPLIIGGKKFDMRLYVLVVSYQPLIVYLYRNGFARFTHHRYDNDDINNQFVHLTNVAIQKTSDNYDTKKGGKWLLNLLKQYLISKYGLTAVSESFHAIQTLIIQALLSVQKVIINDKHCFELYGFDILLDKNLKPWLLEINSSPSMTANTKEDFELKVGLLDDTYTILDLEKVINNSIDTLNEQQKAEFLMQVGGFDCICRNVQIKTNISGQFASFLGSFNNRLVMMKKLAKNCQARLQNIYILQQEQKQNELNERQKEQNNQQINNNNNNMIKKKQPVSYIQTRKNVKLVTKSNQQMTIKQTTQFTQNVIANITNMSNKTTNSNNSNASNNKQFIIKKYKNNINQRKSPIDNNQDDEEEEEE